MFILEALLQQKIVHKEISGNPRNQEEFNSLTYEQGSSMILKSIKLYSQNF